MRIKIVAFLRLLSVSLLFTHCNRKLNVQKDEQSSIQATDEKGLKDYYKDYFVIGVAVSPRSLKGEGSALIVKEFNSITAENAMKTGWLFKDKDGNLVSKEVLLNRLKDHITTVVSRYKGKIYAWDVVNEAVDDNPPNIQRHNSLWYQICGEDFIPKAFEYAHAADPDAILVHNDYNTERLEKRERIYKLLKQLVDAKVPVHAVGLQAHWSLYEPSEKELRDEIERYSSLGLKVHFTEVDISLYPWEKNRRERKKKLSIVVR